MKQNKLILLPFCLMVALLSYGCAQQPSTTQATATPAAVKKQTAQVYKGKVVGKSNKAKTISIKVGKGDKSKTIMVKFDDKTKGINHAVKEHGAIIAYEMRDGEPWATVVKPKFAKMPKGVTEIKVDEMKKLVNSTTDFILIDARPEKRYSVSHLPGAINLGVADYKTKATSILPKNKEQLLVFYCGGPT